MADIFKKVSISIFAALAKNYCNHTGTGGGKGESLTKVEDHVIGMLESNNSQIVSGIESGFETGVIQDMCIYPFTINSIMQSFLSTFKHSMLQFKNHFIFLTRNLL